MNWTIFSKVIYLELIVGFATSTLTAIFAESLDNFLIVFCLSCGVVPMYFAHFLSGFILKRLEVDAPPKTGTPAFSSPLISYKFNALVYSKKSDVQDTVGALQIRLYKTCHLIGALCIFIALLLAFLSKE